MDVERDGVVLVGTGVEDGAGTELGEANMLEVALVTTDVCTLEEVIVVELIDGSAVLVSTAGVEDVEDNDEETSGMVVVPGCSGELGEGIFSLTVLGPKVYVRIGCGNAVVVPVERTVRR